MKQRCLNKNHAAYNRYGGRGIKICDRWLNSFENFYADMGLKPTPKHQMDRVDNDGNYEPGNCRWVTSKQNCRNTKSSKRWVVNGVCYLSLREAVKFLGAGQATIGRWCKGYTTKKGTKMPPRQSCYAFNVY